MIGLAVKGSITPDYHYDVGFNYGKVTQEQQTRNAINGASLNQSLIPLLTHRCDRHGRAGSALSQLTDANFVNLPVYNFFGSGLSKQRVLMLPKRFSS
jgi:hypothetical protein